MPLMEKKGTAYAYDWLRMQQRKREEQQKKIKKLRKKVRKLTKSKKRQR